MTTNAIKTDIEVENADLEWLYEIRERLAAEMEGMTPEEATAFINQRGEEALRELTQWKQNESKSESGVKEALT